MQAGRGSKVQVGTMMQAFTQFNKFNSNLLFDVCIRPTNHLSVGPPRSSRGQTDTARATKSVAAGVGDSSQSWSLLTACMSSSKQHWLHDSSPTTQ